jgi:hypothetical protein
MPARQQKGCLSELVSLILLNWKISKVVLRMDKLDNMAAMTIDKYINIRYYIWKSQGLHEQKKRKVRTYQKDPRV